MKATKDDYLKALRKYHGNVTLAAKHLGVTPRAVYGAINKYKTIKEELPKIRNDRDDAVEAVFLNKVMQGSTPELLFYVKTQLRKRGYQETLKVEHSVEGFINAFNALSPAEQIIAIEKLEESEQKELTN